MTTRRSRDHRGDSGEASGHGHGVSERSAIVVEGTGGVWRVRDAVGETHEAALAGRLKQEVRGANPVGAMGSASSPRTSIRS